MLQHSCCPTALAVLQFQTAVITIYTNAWNPYNRISVHQVKRLDTKEVVPNTKHKTAVTHSLKVMTKYRMVVYACQQEHATSRHMI